MLIADSSQVILAVYLAEPSWVVNDFLIVVYKKCLNECLSFFLRITRG